MKILGLAIYDTRQKKIHYLDIFLMYKVKHKLCPTKISELFHMHCTPYNLRVAVFAIPRFKTKKYDKHSLTYLGPKLRNRLPGEIRTLTTFDEFKNMVFGNVI